MSTVLRSQLEAAAARFANEVVRILRASSLADILAETNDGRARTADGTETKRRPVRPLKGVENAPPRMDLLVAYVNRAPGRPKGSRRAALAIAKSTPTSHARVSVAGHPQNGAAAVRRGVRTACHA